MRLRKSTIHPMRMRWVGIPPIPHGWRRAGASSSDSSLHATFAATIKPYPRLPFIFTTARPKRNSSRRVFNLRLVRCCRRRGACLVATLLRRAHISEGRVAIQDEGSQLVALLAGGGERILDCCAAPGSKTSLLARRNPKAKVYATELHPHRARLLRSFDALAQHPRYRRRRV